MVAITSGLTIQEYHGFSKTEEDLQPDKAESSEYQKKLNT